MEQSKSPELFGQTNTMLGKSKIGKTRFSKSNKVAKFVAVIPRHTTDLVMIAGQGKVGDVAAGDDETAERQLPRRAAHSLAERLISWLIEGQQLCPRG